MESHFKDHWIITFGLFNLLSAKHDDLFSLRIDLCVRNSAMKYVNCVKCITRDHNTCRKSFFGMCAELKRACLLRRAAVVHNNLNKQRGLLGDDHQHLDYKLMERRSLIIGIVERASRFNDLFVVFCCLPQFNSCSCLFAGKAEILKQLELAQLEYNAKVESFASLERNPVKTGAHSRTKPILSVCHVFETGHG